MRLRPLSPIWLGLGLSLAIGLLIPCQTENRIMNMYRYGLEPCQLIPDLQLDFKYFDYFLIILIILIILVISVVLIILIILFILFKY